MPSRNIIKQYKPESFYHVYNRGVAKQPIFHDDHDKAYFLYLIKRHIDTKDPEVNQSKHPHKKFGDRIEVLAYCLMNNHFHLLFYLKENEHGITDFMRSICTAYTMYFNRKYKRVGPLFQGRYKAALINEDLYLMHISRYIHLNPKSHAGYEWSSYKYYLGKKHAVWLKPARILELFEGLSYADFVNDYVDYKAKLEAVKSLLANS